MIIIDIEIKKPNRLKEFFQKLHSKLEDLMFSIVQKLPERFMSRSLMEWLERYANKRVAELNQQIIRDRWRINELEKAADNIHDRQDKEENNPE